MDGYNGTIFAYGQSGSGKTFSMLGPEEVTEVLVSQSSVLTPEVEELFGIVPRATFHMFDLLNEGKGRGTKYMVKVSYLEIYNESVNDILTIPVRLNLKIREFPNLGMCVIGMEERVVTCPENVFECISAGTVNKIVCSTGQNTRSSRSHTVFVITCEQWLIDGTSKVSKINLVDLAGSEKLSKTGAQGQALKEAQKINLSLTTLGRCIKALTGKPGEHVPFRESKLTLILKESLGGNSKTCLIVTGSMRKIHEDETISTLQFAERAKMVKTTAKSNVKRSVEELELMIEQLKAEIVQLKAKLKKGGSFVDENSEELNELKAKFQLLQNSSSKQIEELADELERNRSQMNSDYVNERNSLLNRINYLEEALQSEESKARGLESLKNQLRSELEAAKQEQDDLRLELRGKEELVELVKCDLKEAELSHSQMKAELQALRESNEEFRSLVAKSREDQAESQRRCEELQVELEEMVQIVESLEKDKAESSKLVEQLEKYSFDITLRLEELQRENLDESKIFDTNLSTSSSTSAGLQVQKENEMLRAKLSLVNLDSDRMALVSSLAEGQQEKLEIRAELCRIREDLRANQEIYNVKNVFTDVFSTLQLRLAGLEKDLQSEMGKNQRLSQNMKTFEETRERLIKELENSLRTKMQVTINSLNRKEIDLQTKLSEKEKELKALQANPTEDSTKLKSELLAASSKVSHLNSEIRSLIQDFDVKSSKHLKEKEAWKLITSEKSNEILQLKLEVSEKDSIIDQLKKQLSSVPKLNPQGSSLTPHRSLFRKKTENIPSFRIKDLYANIDSPPGEPDEEEV